MPVAKVASGTNIAYDEFDFTDPWVEPETIVMLHGFSKTRHTWYGWTPHLSRAYRVLVPDMLGHGGSSRFPAGFEMGLEPFSDTIFGFLDALGLDSVHLLSADSSTAVGVEMALRHPERLRTLTLAGFGYNYAAESRHFFDDWIQMLRAEGTAAWARATIGMRIPDESQVEYREWFIAEQAKTSPETMIAVFEFLGELDMTDLLSSIKSQTFIIVGGESRQYPPEKMKLAADLIPGSQLLVIEGASATVYLSSPERAAAATLEFLRAFDAVGESVTT